MSIRSFWSRPICVYFGVGEWYHLSWHSEKHRLDTVPLQLAIGYRREQAFYKSAALKPDIYQL